MPTPVNSGRDEQPQPTELGVWQNRHRGESVCESVSPGMCRHEGRRKLAPMLEFPITADKLLVNGLPQSRLLIGGCFGGRFCLQPPSPLPANPDTDAWVSL